MKELNYEKLKELVSKLPDGDYWYDGEEGIRTEKGSSLNPFAVTYRREIGNAYAALNKELLMDLIKKAQKYDSLNS